MIAKTKAELFLLRGESYLSFPTQWVTMTLASGMGGGVELGGGNKILKMRKFIKFQSLCFDIYYKIDFRVLLQPIGAGKVSAVTVIDKQYNLVSSSRGNKHSDKNQKN